MSRPLSAQQDNSPRIPRFRARRIIIEADRLGQVRATMHHTELGTISGDVHDISLQGIGLVMPGRNSLTGLLLTGDRVDGLEVTWGETVLFRGSGIVRRISEEDDRQILGIEIDGEGLDLPELHRRDARLSFAQRWEQQELGMRYDRIAPEFKAFVADLRSKLEATREFLSAEEQALAHADQLTREETLQQYLDELRPRMLEEMNGSRAQLAALVDHLTDDDHAMHRAYMRRHLAPLFSESPFMRRSFEKPLGYAGDYEMMNMLYRDHAEGSTLFGKALNLYATNEAAARANINRIEYLGEKIRNLIATCDQPRLRIASIGCGPSHEIRSLLTLHPELGRRLDVALIDQEERSIAYCERTLSPLVRQTGARVQFIRESVRKLLTTRRLVEALGERDFIYSAGLFDYLSDRAFSALLSTLYSAVVPGGHLAVGNVAMHNPSRWPMEYFLDWFLIHRTPEDLEGRGRTLEPAASSVHVESEPTGVNLFLIVTR